MLEVRDIHTYYGKSYVLQGVSLKIAAGDIVAMLGRNGAGKTTTLRSIMGLTPPVRGTISFGGQAISGKKTHQISNLGIGYVPGDRQIFTECSVYENLLIGGREGSSWTHERIYEIFPVAKGSDKTYGKGTERR